MGVVLPPLLLYFVNIIIVYLTFVMAFFHGLCGKWSKKGGQMQSEDCRLPALLSMRFEPVFAPSGIGHEGHPELVGSLHLFDDDAFHLLFFLGEDGEVEFVVYL